VVGNRVLVFLAADPAKGPLSFVAVLPSACDNSTRRIGEQT